MQIPGLKFEHKLLKNLFSQKWPNWQQFKYLPHLLSLKEKRTLAALLVLFIVSAFTLIIRLPRVNLVCLPANGGSYIEGVVGAPHYINPILAKAGDVDADLSKLIFSGLFKYNKNLEIVPDLTQKLDISEDGLQYKIQLKNNAFWHDGKKLTIDDIIYTTNIIKTPRLKNRWTDVLQNVQIIKIDEQNIKFVLTTANPEFLQDLTFGILPQHIWQSIPTEQFQLTEYNSKPIGSGPFKFKNLTRDSHGLIKSYTLEKNNNFYDRKTFLDRVTFNFYQNFEAMLMPIQKREINGVSYAPKYLQDKFLAAGFFKKYPLQLPQYNALFFNLTSNDLIGSKTIRKALAYAVPKEKIISDVLFGEGQVIDSPILPNAFGYNPGIKKYEYDPAKAMKILENSGWHKNENGFWQKDNKILELSITTVQQPDMEKIGEIIQKSWQAIGIRTKLISVPAETIQKDIIVPRNYQALLYGVVTNFNSDPLPFWHSSKIKPPGLNLSNFSNKRVDDLLEKAQNYPFEDVKKKKYLEFQDIISEEVPAIFLYSTSYSYLVDKKIKGVMIEKINLPSDRLNNINEWYIKTKQVSKK